MLLAASAAAEIPVPDSRAQADRFLDRAMESLVSREDSPPGAISVVQRGNEVTVHKAGVAELGVDGAPRKRMHMRIASTAKAMSGAVALTLVDRGVLSLDDTVGEWLPSLPAAWHPVTLRELLHHTGGIPDFTQSPGFGPAVGANPLNPPPPIDLLGYAGTGLSPTAGSYSYSNSDNIIVGLMVEAATGSSYQKEIVSLVADPLGLRRTYLYSAPTVATPYIHGYNTADPANPVDVTNEIDFGGWAWASGGVVSTPGNLNGFIRGYVGGVARKDPGDFIEGGHSEPRGPGHNAAGLALFKYEMPCGTVYGHTGSIFGYTQFMASTADGRRSVTMSINAQYGDSLLPKLRKVEERAVCAALA